MDGRYSQSIHHNNNKSSNDIWPLFRIGSKGHTSGTLPKHAQNHDPFLGAPFVAFLDAVDAIDAELFGGDCGVVLDCLTWDQTDVGVLLQPDVGAFYQTSAMINE